MDHQNWNGFVKGSWQDEINVRDFIQKNYKEYTGDSAFLSSATERTKALMEKVQALFKEERKRGGVLDVDAETVTSLTNYAPGYVDKENELISTRLTLDVDLSEHVTELKKLILQVFRR